MSKVNDIGMGSVASVWLLLDFALYETSQEHHIFTERDIQQELGFLKVKMDVKSYAELSYVKEGAKRMK